MIAPDGVPRVGDRRRLLRLVVPHWHWLALAAILGVAAIGANIALMGLSAYLISRAAIADSVAELALAVTGVRTLAISRAALRYLERTATHRSMFRILTTIRTWFFAAVEPLAPARLSELRSGDLLARLVNDVDAMEEFYVRVLLPPLVAAVVVAVMSLVYGLFDPLMGVLLLAFLLLTGVVLPLTTRWLSGAPAREMAALRGATSALLIDQLQGAADLAALDADGNHRLRLLARGGQLDAVRRRLGAIEGIADALSGLLAALAAICIVALAIPLVTEGKLEGVFLAVLPLAAIAAFEAVQPLSRSLQLLDATGASAGRLFSIVDAVPAVRDPVPAAPLPAASLPSGSRAPRLGIRDLSFRYDPDGPWVLRHLDLDVAPGERVALLGPSGCGKSTLVSLLARFWDVPSGSIWLAGRDIREFAQDAVRALLAVVPQDVHLFDATVRDNLAVADADASDEQMEAACRIAQLHHVIEALPRGYETFVGEDGARLSSGERRRLAIARAILADRPFVILDEATADLDPTTELALWAALDAWLVGRSLLLIGHQQPAVAFVDRVVEMPMTRSAD